jgi:hypothetical protein
VEHLQHDPDPLKRAARSAGSYFWLVLAVFGGVLVFLLLSLAPLALAYRLTMSCSARFARHAHACTTIFVAALPFLLAPLTVIAAVLWVSGKRTARRAQQVTRPGK